MSEADALLIGGWIAAALRSATPLLVVMLGATLAQRASLINLGVEGEMLAGACVGFAVAAATSDPLIGLLAGGLAGLALSVVFAGLALGARANQIATGIAVWMIGLGVTSYAGRAYVGQKVATLPTLAAFLPTPSGVLRPVVEQVSVAVPAALLLTVLAGLWLYRTRPGLAWRTVGESAETGRVLGISVTAVKVQAVLAEGLLAGIAGAVLSVDYTQTWAQDMTKGRGLVAVGLVIVARWNPYLVIPVAMLFALGETSVLRLQAAGLSLSPSLLAALPYLLAIAVVVIFQSRVQRAGTMPSDLASIFRTR